MSPRRLTTRERQRAGRTAARRPIHVQDDLWATHSNDKPDIAVSLVRVIRTMSGARGPGATLRVLSFGSSTEPQLPILQPTFTGGVHLLDTDPAALDVVRATTTAKSIGNVHTIRADYTSVLGDDDTARRFRARRLGGRRMSLLTFHHSLYYCPRSSWDLHLGVAYRELLDRPRAGAGAAIHAVLMANRSTDPTSTTSIYDRWAGTLFDARNDQDLAGFGRSVRHDERFAGSQVRQRRSRVRFDTADFTDFMSVVWMILLHPQVHRFTPAQQDEVSDWVYTDVWSKGRPLVQDQDHLAIYRGTTPRGLV